MFENECWYFKHYLGKNIKIILLGDSVIGYEKCNLIIKLNKNNEI